MVFGPSYDWIEMEFQKKRGLVAGSLLGPLGCLFSDRRPPRMRNELSVMQVASGQHERSDMRG
jgi:hypothetical protein